MPLKVLITTNIPSPYFVDYANELSKYVDLTVVFELKKASDRNKNWEKNPLQFRFSYAFLNAKRLNKESGLSFKIFKYLKDKTFNKIIIANPLTPTGIISLLYLRRNRISFIIQSEGGFSGSGKGLKEKFKKYLMKKADFYLTGMGDSKDYFLAYGASLDKLKRYNFTSIHQSDILHEPLNEVEKTKIKKILKLNYKKIILYVGQFIDRKDIPTLLKAFSGFDNNVCLILVGGNPLSKYRKIEKKFNLSNVYYFPFKEKNEIKEFYKAADVFVLPTKEDTWGLVINEAMSYGLPIISTNKCIAANQLIKNGINGYMVNVGDDKSINYYLNKILYNKKLCESISINNIRKINDYTIEKMAITIYNHIKN